MENDKPGAKLSELNSLMSEMIKRQIEKKTNVGQDKNAARDLGITMGQTLGQTLAENPVSPQSTNHENYDAVDNQLESGPTSPSSGNAEERDWRDPVLQTPRKDRKSQFEKTQYSTQYSTQQNHVAGLNSSNTKTSQISDDSQFELIPEDILNSQGKGQQSKWVPDYGLGPKRPSINPRIITQEDKQKKTSQFNLNDDQTEDSFDEALPGIEVPFQNKVDEDKKKLEEEERRKEKQIYTEEYMEEFFKKMGIKYTKCTPREFYGGFKEDNQFPPTEEGKKEAESAAEDLMSWKKGDPIWRKKEINGFVYLQLMKPGYACNPQEMIENRHFTKVVTNCLEELSQIADGKIMTDKTADEKKVAQEKLKSKIKDLFDYGRRQINPRWDNLKVLEEWKQSIASKWEIDF